MNIGIWGWDTANTKWVKMLVDSLGHVQTDIISSALPSGAATETTLDLVRAELDGIEGLLAAGLPAALDSGALKVREQGTPSVHLYGYDTANWQTLLVQDATYHNLRVGIFEGSDQANVDSAFGTVAGSTLALIVKASLMGTVGGNIAAISANTVNADNVAATYRGLCVQSFLHGFDGSTWDRISVSAAKSIMTKEETSNPCSSGVLTSSQLIHGNPAHLYGITINKITGSIPTIRLIDGLNPSGTVLWEMTLPGVYPETKNFYPWLGFDTGLYLQITASGCSVIVEYGDAT